MKKGGFIYFLTNWTNEILYIGITNNLERRIVEHQKKLVSGFSKKYNLKKLVYYELYDDITIAIKREKQLKNWSRKKKNFLVEKLNPEWDDLYENTQIRSLDFARDDEKVQI